MSAFSLTIAPRRSSGLSLRTTRGGLLIELANRRKSPSTSSTRNWSGTRRWTGSCTSRARGRAMRTAAEPRTVRLAAGGAAELVNAQVGTHGVLYERHQRDLH